MTESNLSDHKVDKVGHDAASEASFLAGEHRRYLLELHGTLELDPVPCMGPDEPLNWPTRKKVLNLALVSFHAFMFSFTAAAIQCAFVEIAEDLGVSVQRASYLTSLFIGIMGVAALFWAPLSHTFGRRPIFLLSLAGALLGNVGCGLSVRSYGAMAFFRAVTAFFVSPAGAVGGAVVSETFFTKDRGRCMGVWTVMMTLGVPLAPLVFGFVALRVGYRYIYWTLAITNAVQIILHLLFGSETRYEPTTATRPSAARRCLAFRRIDPRPLKWFEFVRPLTFVTRRCVAISAASYAMVFLFGSIMTTLEIPQIFPRKFGLNTQQIGLQNISIIIGTLAGEQLGGFSSDKWMWLRERRGSKPCEPEFRLWLSYVGYLFTIFGVIIFFVQLDRASNTWNVTPLVGAGLAAAGNQMVTTILVTYAIDCYPRDAAAVGAFINVVRQTWGFIGPFWFPQMIEGLGYTRSAAVPTGMILGVSVLPTMLLQWKGRSWNRADGQRRPSLDSSTMELAA